MIKCLSAFIVIVFSGLSFSAEPVVKGPFNTFHELGETYIESARSITPILEQVPAEYMPRMHTVWRAPDGFPCRGPSECLSNFCHDRGHYGKSCGSPDIFCRSQGGPCSNDCDCCSNLCSSSGTCIADGASECVSNGQSYVVSDSECCSKNGSVTTKTCMPSALQCVGLDVACSTDSQCCSKVCGSYGTCVPGQPSSDYILYGK
jgi:hypothetical protein